MWKKCCGSVLILHPFGCLVSHVCERGILQRLHARFPDVSIQTIEYDYDQSKTLEKAAFYWQFPRLAAGRTLVQ